MLVQYAKYGSVSKLRALILSSFAYYMLAAFYVTLLPLPDPASLGGRGGPSAQLIPFRFVYDFIRETPFRLSDANSWLPALRQPALFVPIFNVLLTMPFGVYLAYYFQRSFKATVLLSFALALFFEITQLTGIYGIYAEPYRLFDVDDLTLNTLGGALGFVIMKRWLAFLPSREKIDADNHSRSENVGYTRRFFAFVIDFFLATFATRLLLTLIHPLIGQIAYDLIADFGFILYCILSQFFFRRTVGKRIVQIRLEPYAGKRPWLVSLLLRYGLLFSFQLCLKLLQWASAKIEGGWPLAAMSIAQTLLLLLAGVDFLASFRRGKQLMYEKISRMRNANTKKSAGSE
jgi:glycopeptide antibiotics resistance protein